MYILMCPTRDTSIGKVSKLLKFWWICDKNSIMQRSKNFEALKCNQETSRISCILNILILYGKSVIQLNVYSVSWLLCYCVDWFHLQDQLLCIYTCIYKCRVHQEMDPQAKEFLSFSSFNLTWYQSRERNIHLIFFHYYFSLRSFHLTTPLLWDF